jgi:hypothetical protein
VQSSDPLPEESVVKFDSSRCSYLFRIRAASIIVLLRG